MRTEKIIKFEKNHSSLVMLLAGLSGVLCSGINGVLWRGILAYFHRNIYLSNMNLLNALYIGIHYLRVMIFGSYLSNLGKNSSFDILKLWCAIIILLLLRIFIWGFAIFPKLKDYRMLGFAINLAIAIGIILWAYAYYPKRHNELLVNFAARPLTYRIMTFIAAAALPVAGILSVFWNNHV